MMSFKEKLKKGPGPLIGTWLTLPSPAVAEIVCRAGFDWAAIDLEHSPMNLESAEGLIRVIDLMGKIPLVRITNNDATLIKRVMDAGAHGIIVPMVNSLSDVEDASKALYYPPRGKRGVGLARAQQYGANFHGYREWLEKEAIFIAQIEHKDALSQLDAIFGSGLIDGYLIGPYDLSASLGVPGEFTHPLVLEALAVIEDKAQKYNTPKGIHLVEMDENNLKSKIASGYQLIAYGVDFRVLESNFRQARLSFDRML